MKKLYLTAAAALALAVAAPATAQAEETTKEASATVASMTDQQRADMLTARLFEIYGLSKGDLSYAEKKELRKEVRTIKNQLQVLDRRVSISIGALIIIILLLIIIF